MLQTGKKVRIKQTGEEGMLVFLAFKMPRVSIAPSMTRYEYIVRFGEGEGNIRYWPYNKEEIEEVGE